MFKFKISKYKSYHWLQNGKRHRDDGPAVVYISGEQRWYQNDLLHRDDGPAVICRSGYCVQYQNGE